jgi:hypothetical protein
MYFGGLKSITWSDLTNTNERFEEAEDEAILLADTHPLGPESYTSTFMERIFHQLYQRGLNFDEAGLVFLKEFEPTFSNMERIALQEGMWGGSIFYRRVDTPKDFSKSPHPQIPAEIY